MQNSVAKKIFAVGSAVAMTIALSVPLAAFAAPDANGTNISDSTGTVYTIINGQRDPYTSAGAYLSYGFNSWSNVVPASSDDLALPVGAFIPPQDGSIICSDRGSDQGTCYEISGGQKFGFTSAAVFTGLGFSFANSMPGDVSWMTSGANLINSSSMAHLTGTLVNNGGTVQLVGANGLLGIPDLATFNSWGYSFSKVVPADAADTMKTQTGVMVARIAGQLSPSWNTSPTSPTNPGSPVVSGNVSASLSSDTPAAGTLVSTALSSPQTPGQETPGQVSAILANFTMSGTGTVTQVVVNRIGVSSDSSINNVYLYMGNNRITDAGSFSNGMVTFSNSNGLFTVNGSTEISVRVDVAGNVSGQTVGAQLASFTVANGSPMATSISGNLFTIAQISNLATVQVQGIGDSAVTGPGASINAGLTNQVLWSVPISVGQRSVLLKYIAFKQIGSIPQSAIQNLRLMIDGTQVGTTGSITNNGSNTNVVTFDLTGNPVTLATGGHTLSLNGDIVGGTSFTFGFSLQQAADAVFFDTNYNVNVPIVFSNSNSIFQLTPTALTTISSGTVSVQLDPSFTATQFVTNASQVVLGSWTMKAYGEDVKVQNLKVLLNYFVNGVLTNASTTDGFNNLTVTVNGGGVGSSQNALFQTSGSNSVSTGINTFTFGTSNLFTIPAGTTVTVQVKGDSTFATTDSVNSVRADINTPQNSLQGVTSFALSPSATLGTTYTGTTLTTSSSNATLTKNTAYSNQTVGSNMTAQHIGSYVIQASSADGVRVTSLAVGLGNGSTFNQYGSGITTGLANVYIVTPAGSTTPIQPSATSTFSVNFTVAANQTATVDVYADVSNATGTIITDLAGSGVGATSNQAVTFAPSLGQQITVGNGTINNPPTRQTSSPLASFVIGGSTSPQPAATFNFVASSGGSTIQELDFDTANASGTAVAITSVTVGGVTAPMVNSSSTVTGLSIAVPTSLGGIDVPVTVTYAGVGSNGIAANQQFTLRLIRVKYLSGSTTQYVPSSGYSVLASSNSFDLVGSYPTVALASSASRLTAGTVIIGQVTITANAAGNVVLEHLPVTLAANNATISANSIIAVDASSGVTAATSSNQSLVSGTSGSQTATLDFTSLTGITSDNNIAAGTSKTYNIEAVISAVGNSTNGNPSVSFGLGDAGSLTFKDVNGGADAVTGKVSGVTYLTNYPTNTVSIAP